MEENNESFLKILSDYFSNLSEHKIVTKSNGNISIPMGWISASKLDRYTIEQAFINIFCSVNKQYKEKIKKDPNFYGKISSLEIEKTTSGVNLIIKARDTGTQTKIVVTSEENLRGPFYAISEDKLYREVLYSYNFGKAKEISKKLNLSPEERNRLLKEEFKRPEIEESRKAFIKSEMIDAAKNLVRYYDYMSKINTKYNALQGTISQRKDYIPRGPKMKKGAYANRKSEIYNFIEREEIFLEMNPSYIVNIDNIEENNTRNFAYVTYVYENPREKDGYLFIAEPVEGVHSTRVRYVSKEEYEESEAIEGKNKITGFAEEMTEMSNSEFSNHKHTKTFRHTTLENQKEKFRRLVLGESPENMVYEPRYAEIDTILFDGKRKIDINGIKDLASGVKILDINRGRTALYAREENKERAEV